MMNLIQSVRDRLSQFDRVKLIHAIEQAIFSIRWLLLPLYAGLVAALGLYIVHFVHEVYEMVANWWHNTADQNVLMLFILELVDMVMISQLVVMTIQGGYSIFVKEFDFEFLQQRPRWLTNGLGSSEQKIKMGMSIVGIMMVHFLKDFIQMQGVNQQDLWMREQMMGCVVLGTFAFCYYNLLMHSPALNHDAPHPGSTHTEHEDHH